MGQKIKSWIFYISKKNQEISFNQFSGEYTHNVLLTIKIRFKSPYKKIKVWPLKDISRTVTNFKKLIEQNMFEITRNLLFFLLFASKKEWLAF